MSKYFHELEFKACTPSCSISQMDSRFLVLMDELRVRCGFPLVVNCAYRSQKYDLLKGRSGNSYHTKGRAMDIRCLDSEERAVILREALILGLSVGVYPRFLHIDDRGNDSNGKTLVFYGY